MKQNSEAKAQWNWAVAGVYFVAAMNLLLGWYANASGTGRLGDLQLSGAGLMGAGILYLVLGVFVHNRSTAALWIALVLFGLDSIGMVMATAQSGHFTMWAVWIRIALLATMYRGIPALAELQKPIAPPSGSAQEPSAEARREEPTVVVHRGTETGGYELPIR